MAQSLSKVLIHLIFSTKHRTAFLQSDDLRHKLYAYMATILKEHRCPALAINGTADHVHILCQLARTISLAELVEEIKTQPSKWIKTQGVDYRDFHWQNGYAVFSVSQSNMERVKRYIEKQEEHHAKMSFQEELRRICEKHGVEIDERYVWD